MNRIFVCASVLDAQVLSDPITREAVRNVKYIIMFRGRGENGTAYSFPGLNASQHAHILL